MLEVILRGVNKENHITDPLYQYDVGQKMRIKFSGLTTAPIIHFSNAYRDTALNVSASLVDDVITVSIPNSLLAEPYPILAYVYDIEEDSGRTIHVIKIPIIKRPKPSDYESLNDEDLINYERLDARLTQLVNEWSGALDDTQNAVAILTTKVNSVVSGTVSVSMGMVNSRISFGEDGSITEIGDGWSRVTTFETDGSIREVFTTNESGEEKTITKVTTFNDDGSINAVLVD